MKLTVASLRSAVLATVFASTLPALHARDAEVDSGASSTIDALAALFQNTKSFSVKATAEMPAPAPGGSPVKTESTITLQKPLQISALVKAGGESSSLTCDGKALVAFDAKANTFIRKPAPAALGPLLGQLAPGLDSLLALNPRTKILEDVIRVTLAGEEQYGGATCQRLHFVQKDGEVDVWIEKSAKPVPRGLRVTGQIEAHFDDWQLDPKLDAGAFTFTPPADAKETKAP